MSLAFKKSLNVTVALATVWGAMPTQAFAACGGSSSSGGSGPPSISATEVSTAQALQFLRKRQDEALSGGTQFASNVPPAPPAAADQPPPPPKPVVSQTTTPKPPVNVSAGNSATSGSKAASSTNSSASSQAATDAQQAAKQKATATKVPYKEKPTPVVVADKPAPINVQGHVYSLKDDGADFTLPNPTRGAWGSGYFDYEHHSGWTANGGQRGALSSTSRTFGVLSGTDWVVRDGGSKVIVGMLGGYSTTRTDFSSNIVATPSLDSGGGLDVFQRSGASETTNGGGGGVYALLANGRFTADAMFKVDGYNLEQQDSVLKLGTIPTGGSLSTCNGTQNSIGRNGSVDYATFVLSSNIAYRYTLDSASWFEPTFGVRYTHASYGSQSGTLPLGYIDGDDFRIQGGARLGHATAVGDGSTVITTLTGLLYSDVAMSGFSQSSGGFNSAIIDEGKLRGLGQLTAALIKGNGLTYTATGEVRGGDQLFGVGGKLGVRYEW